MKVDCHTLSVAGHRYCTQFQCDCPCHLRNWVPNESGRRDRRRPHSYPRLDWQRRLPAGQSEQRKLTDRLTRRTW